MTKLKNIRIKKNIRNGVLAAVVLAGLGTSQAMAMKVTLFAGTIGPGNYQAAPSDGLEYVLGNYAASALGSATVGGQSLSVFGTFCLEKTEYFNPKGTYNVVLNDRAIGGGTSPTPGYDIISKGTAYLYEQFALGNPAAGNSRLQNWFWFLEQEISLDLSEQSLLLAALAPAGLTDIAAARVNYDGSAVRVMNLTDAAGNYKQDQLVYVPARNTPPVPDGGATLMLMGIALVGMAALRRKASA